MKKRALAVLVLLVLVMGLFQARRFSASAQYQEKFMTDNQKAQEKITVYNAESGQYQQVEKVNKSNDEWKKELSRGVYHITREQGTEPPFTGKLNYNKDTGVYECAACGNDLFVSDHKFNSGTGWPSFYKPVDSKNVALVEDNSHGMRRIEVVCARCHSHLGHVFDDGPPPTGKRYCINSAAMKFVRQEKSGGSKK